MSRAIEIPPTYFARVLRALRERRRWSYGDLAYECGIDAARLWRFEHDERRPSLDEAAALARAFAVGLDAFDEKITKNS